MMSDHNEQYKWNNCERQNSWQEWQLENTPMMQMRGLPTIFPQLYINKIYLFIIQQFLDA